MKKIISLFKRNYDGNRLVYDSLVPGAEWVQIGEGIATIKYDGTCCMIRGKKLFKRYDRKLTKLAHRRKKKNPDFVPSVDDFKPMPEGWQPAEETFNVHTGHWPGWLLIGDGPEDQYYREGFVGLINAKRLYHGTCELIGPKVQGNPYDVSRHMLVPHGDFLPWHLPKEPPRDFDGLQTFFETAEIEGIVWHHPDGRMVKIKRRDFGFKWPVKLTN